MSSSILFRISLPVRKNCICVGGRVLFNRKGGALALSPVASKAQLLFPENPSEGAWLLASVLDV